METFAFRQSDTRSTKCSRLMRIDHSFLLITGICVLMLGCTRQSELRVEDLPPNAFTVRGTALNQVTRDDGAIPDQYWGASIRALKPVRVYRDRNNIAVVTKPDDKVECGIYFHDSISSYIPWTSPVGSFTGTRMDTLSQCCPA